MNKKWPNEKFKLGYVEIMKLSPGAFDTIFNGSNHTIRIHAFVDVEQTGRHPPQFKVEVYARKTKHISICVNCCCCCCFG
jgi:hypothetical protein